MTRNARSLALTISLWALGCSESTLGPSATEPRILSIAPPAGASIGGTVVMITGANFSGDASVVIGDVPATQVLVADSATLSATTGPHDAGLVDVVVIVKSKRAVLPAGYRYVAPEVVNLPPVISSLIVKGTKPREPELFSDLDEAVRVSASISDAETPVSDLGLAWSADAGNFTGGGPSVTWTAPHDYATPTSLTLTLTVTERYNTTNSLGVPVTRENVVTTTRAVRLHNSAREVGDLALDFLAAFSKQLNPDYVLRNFTSDCDGTARERDDVIRQQRDHTMIAYTIGAPVVTVGFTGRCPFLSAFGDACAQIPATWTSIYKPTGNRGTVVGIDQVTAVLEDDRWWLCASNWNQTSSTFSTIVRFTR